jgi:histidinol phosphatase-like enzyme (inositol monophosphatase family)
MEEATVADLSELRRFAETIAAEAGELTLTYFRRGIDVEYKADQSPVTEADRETERLLRSRIHAGYPEHSIAGEELGMPEHRGEWTWVLDPIDGTKSFVHGIPLYTVLVALLHNDAPVLGVIHNPALGETVSAAVGSGCTYNGEHCRIRRCDSLEAAEVCTSDFLSLAREAPELHRRLVEGSRFGRTWADAYGYLLVATGRIDVMIDPKMAVWDIAPLYPVIEEAGGTISDLAGRRAPLGGSAVVAHPRLHPVLVSGGEAV